MDALLIRERNSVVVKKDPSLICFFKMTVPNWIWTLEIREPEGENTTELKLNFWPFSALTLAISSKCDCQGVYVNLESSKIQD